MRRHGAGIDRKQEIDSARGVRPIAVRREPGTGQRSPTGPLELRRARQTTESARVSAHETQPTRLRSGSIVVGALLSDRRAVARIRRELRDIARLYFCVDRGELQARVRHAEVDLVIVAAVDAGGVDNSAAVATVRSLSRVIPILVLCRSAAPHMRALMSLARAGADDIILEDGGDIAAVVAEYARLVADRSMSQRVLDDLQRTVPTAVYPIVSHCVSDARAGLSVDALARAVGVSRRTIGNRLAAAGLGPPGSLIMWGRLLLAAYLLAGTDETVERVAASAGFTSAAAFRVASKRYTGLRPLDIRRPNGHESVVARFLDAQRLAVA